MYKIAGTERVTQTCQTVDHFCICLCTDIQAREQRKEVGSRVAPALPTLGKTVEKIQAQQEEKI